MAIASFSLSAVRTNSTRDLIITHLNQKPTLNGKNIHNTITGDRGKKISCRTVHKTLDLASKGGYVIFTENTPMDRVIAGLWKKFGFQIKFGVNYSCNYDFLVYHDKFFQIFFSNELKNALDKLFINAAKDLEEITPKEYYETYYQPSKTTVTVIENRQLAEQLKEDVKKYFREAN